MKQYLRYRVDCLYRNKQLDSKDYTDLGKAIIDYIDASRNGDMLYAVIGGYESENGELEVFTYTRR